MDKWQEPKTDWMVDDIFLYSDYNRIKNNLTCLWQDACAVFGDFEIADMGEDITSNEVDWDVDYFNAFEENVDTINKNMLSQDYGFRQTFYENGIFIGYMELNRIEEATFDMKRTIEGILAGKVRIPFRCGAPKGLYL